MPSERAPLLENGDSRSCSAPPAQNHKPGPMEISRSTRYGILAGIWVANFLSVRPATLVATLLPSISSDFQKSNQASWLGTSYLLATCTFTPLYGRLCNVMGRRGANQLAVFFAAIGTLACGLSGSMEGLIAARFLSGLGGGGIMTTATIITSDMYSIRSRGLTQGIASVFSGLGMGLGGPLGGVISDRFGWRWAFLIQLPLFVLSFLLTSVNLRYTTPGKGKSTKDVLKRIDYGGSATLMGAVLSVLVFLSNRYNEERTWDEPSVIVPVVFSVVFFVAFVIFELRVAAEPMLAPFLLKQKIPVLVGVSNYLVATCNFAVMYFFPMWFQTVALTSASTAGLHLLPNSISMSVGSMFAGWMMHRTGKYKKLNLIFGVFPFTAAVLITKMREDSGPLQLWLSIIPLGFGNAVVLQTMLIALLAHIPHSSMAVGTGFGQLFRGIGQVGGVGIASAIFQHTLDTALRERIDGPDAAKLIKDIRHSARLVASLPPDVQRQARDSYALALRAVFTMAAVSTLLAYLVRLPIPEKELEHQPRPKALAEATVREDPPSSVPETPFDSDDERDDDRVPPLAKHQRPVRRLSTYESLDGGMDLESDDVGGSARQQG
ncbi:MFS general substrate transporter [Artomyces pyxidatus]|uniref:MFS general substrate transporter n=1 Tax=Artomyces pyxidatus TaxID=48021 RepID=A0ACB8T0F2_9AGAM|nr:MFS general substrate transporter [Artomyces pyxidatus]